MRVKLLIISFLLILIYLASPCNCYSVGEGGMPGYFLDLGAGARALGMGRAFVALADDTASIYWNPAGLYQVEKREISAMHIILYENTRYDFIGYTQPIGKFWNIGIGGIQLATGGAIRRDEYNNPGEEFSDQNNALFLTNSFQITENILFGFNVKYINKIFDTINDTFYGSDIGILIKPTKIINIGLNIQNWLLIMPPTAVETTRPKGIIRPGIALKLFKERFILTGDLDICKERSIRLHLGTETNLFNSLFIRAGYDNKSLTWGGGLKYKYYKVDYAFINHELGLSHRVSINIQFGKTLAEIKEEKIQTKQRNERINKNLIDGTKYYSNKNWSKALEKYSQVLSDDKNNEEAIVKSNKLNEILKDIGGHKAAAIAYRVSEKPDDALKEWEIISTLESKDDFKNNKEEITKLYNKIADLKLKNKDMDAAMTYWDKALIIDSENKEAGMGIKKIEELKENEKQKQIEIHSKEAGKYFNSKNWESSLTEWKEVLKIDIESKTAIEGIKRIEEEKGKETGKLINSHIEMAKIYLNNKEWESSIKEWNTVLEIAPKNEIATEGLRNVEETKRMEMKKENERLRTIAVIDFKALGVPSTDAIFASEFLRTALVNSNKFRVIEKANMDKIMSEQGFQQTGCTSSDCAVQLGKVLNVKKMITGSFGKFGEIYQIVISVVDVETGEIVYSDKKGSESIQGVSTIVDDLAKDIVNNLTGGTIE